MLIANLNLMIKTKGYKVNKTKDKLLSNNFLLIVVFIITIPILCLISECSYYNSLGISSDIRQSLDMLDIVETAIKSYFIWAVIIFLAVLFIIKKAKSWWGVAVPIISSFIIMHFISYLPNLFIETVTVIHLRNDVEPIKAQVIRGYINGFIIQETDKKEYRFIPRNELDYMEIEQPKNG